MLDGVTEATVHSKYNDVNFRNIRINVNRCSLNSFERSKVYCMVFFCSNVFY
jgi:hypothetical protein